MDNELAAALVRIEQRQTAYERVAHEIVAAMGVHTEMLTAILKAATMDPGPSPTAEALHQISVALKQQTALLIQLPEALAGVIRGELAVDLGDDETEPAEGAFEREAAER